MTDWQYGYRIGNYAFCLTGEDPELEILAAGIYRGARAPDPVTGEVFRLGRDRSGYALCHRDQVLCQAPDLPSAFAAVEWALTEACLAGLGSSLQLHAGVVGVGDQAWLLAGPPESGKTSLVLGLFAAGAAVLTDEVALLDPATRCVASFPRDLIVRQGTLRRFGGTLPEVEPPWKRFVDRRYLCPADLSRSIPTSLPVARLIFPRLAPSRSFHRRYLGQAEAARRLLDQALNLDLWGSRGMEAVAALVECAPAIEVTFGDGRVAARSLLASWAS